MILEEFDQSRKNELTFYGESVRLYNETLPKPSKTFIDNITGERTDIPAKRGIDLRICSFNECVNFLADTRIKKSESSMAFVHRIMAVRFSTEYAQSRDKIDTRYKMEYELIQSKAKNEMEFLGEVGFQNMVRLDNSLTDNRSKPVINRSGIVKIVRK